jgi:hypothetical protein
LLGVGQLAEIRRLYFVEKRSKRAIHRLTGVHRDTIARAIESGAPPQYVRAPAGSKLDPFQDWICEQLVEDPSIQSQRLRELALELGYAGGKTIFDDWVWTTEVCWSRVIAGALVFSKEAPDILWGLGRCLERIGGLPEKLVWDREGAIAPAGRPTDQFACFCAQLGVGWVILDRGDAQAKGALERSHRASVRTAELRCR